MSDAASTGGGARMDAFTLRRLHVPMAAAFALGVIYSISQILGLFFYAVGLVAGAGWLIWMMISAIFALRVRCWKRAASFLGISLVIWPLAAIALVFGDYLHFAPALPYYELEVSTTPDSGSKEIAFEWDGTGFAGVGTTDRAVIHDPTGRLARFGGGRYLPGEDRIWESSRHLIGDFYLVETFF